MSIPSGVTTILITDLENAGVNGKTLHGLLVEPTTRGVRVGVLNKKGIETKNYLAIPAENIDALIAALQEAKIVHEIEMSK